MRRLLFLLIPVLALVACTSEYDNMLNNAQRAARSAGDDIVFYATIEGATDADPQTKVYADEQMRVLWNADDRISIFNKKTSNQEYKFMGEVGDNAGNFEAVGTIGEGNGLSYIYAVYPYAPETSIEGDGLISFSLPAEQTYQANSFGKGANTMVSVTEDNMLRFKNAGGFLSFKFYGEGVSVKSITLKGNNHEKLAGKATITMSAGGTPTVVMQNDATESVTLICDEPVALNASAENYTEFWFVIPPTEFPQGLTVTVTDDKGGTFEKSTSNVIKVDRNNLGRMSPMEVTIESSPALPTYKIGDFLDSDGLGVVVGVDGDECLLMSVSEARGKTWPESNTWCTSYGEGWRMPTIEELTLIHESLDTINAALLNYGYTRLPTLYDNKSYWSSTVNPSDANYYYRELLGDGRILTNLRDGELNFTRAVKIVSTVPDPPTGVDGVELNRTVLSLSMGDKELLMARVSPYNTINNVGLVWESSEPSVATVEAGLVKAVGEGITTITVSSVDGVHSASCTITVVAQGLLVVFEDANFKKFCVANYDTDADGAISISEAEAVTTISVNTETITSLKGIECFTNLEQLTCSPAWTRVMGDYWYFMYSNTSTSSDNWGYWWLVNDDSQGVIGLLDTLDLSQNTALQELNCSGNHLSSLDVSSNTKLKKLDCACNRLTTLDLSSCPELTHLTCSFNNFSSLSVANCTELTSLKCVLNLLTALDVSCCPALTSLDCGHNRIQALDVSGNTALTDLDCGINLLTSLNVGMNTQLIYLTCRINQLTTLDVSSCTELQSLDCSSNYLTSLVMSNNAALTWLFCDVNQLTTLNVSTVTALQVLSCKMNQLTTLDVSNNTQLYELNCNYNQYLTEIWLKTNQTIPSFYYDKNVATIRYKD